MQSISILCSMVPGPHPSCPLYANWDHLTVDCYLLSCRWPSPLPVCVVVCAFVFGCVCSALREGHGELRIGDDRIGCMAYASGLQWSSDGELRHGLLQLGTRLHPQSIEKQVPTVRSPVSPRSYGLSGPVWKVKKNLCHSLARGITRKSQCTF